MDGDGTYPDITISREAIFARLWARRYQYGLKLLDLKRSEVTDKLFKRQFEVYHNPEKAVESALWQVADANKLDSPGLVARTVKKAVVFDTIENFEADNFALVSAIRASALIAIIGALIVKPSASIVVSLGLAAFLLTARFFNLPSKFLAMMNLALYAAIFAILLDLYF